MSLINEALKQTRGATSQSPQGGPAGIPISHPRSEERRSLRTDVLLVSAVLLLPLLLLGGAALLYLIKRDTQSTPVPPPAPAAINSVPSPTPAHTTTPDVTQSAARSAALPSAPARPPSPVAPGGAIGPGTRVAASGAREPTPAVTPAPSANTPETSRLPASRETLAKLKLGLKLTAVVGSGANVKALVNGRILKVGDTLEGALVVAIGNDAVTLELAGEKTDLTLH